MKIYINNIAISPPHGASIADLVPGTHIPGTPPVLAARLDGKLVDLSTTVPNTDTEHRIELVDVTTEDGMEVLRHSTSHLMTQALLRLRGPMSLGAGPATSDGFYQDFDTKELSINDLSQIEAEMRKLIAEDVQFVRREVSRNEALAMFATDPLKVEIINDQAADAIISIYQQAERTDLCRGPHVPRSGLIDPDAFKLLRVSGSYWRGDSKREQLTRIYGVVFSTKAELDSYLHRIEEAEKRDHRRIGEEMGLLHFSEHAKGMPFFLPDGAFVFNQLEGLKREMLTSYGYDEVRTPTLMDRTLWERSGHWEHYQANMFTVETEDGPMAMKPMNCPGACLIYESAPRSYRDLPIRLGEFGHVHRFENSGALHGLLRVRAFTQDDAHLFVRQDQIANEVLGCIKMYRELYACFGFEAKVSLSTRPAQRMGADSEWEHAESSLVDALEQAGMSYNIKAGDGAFYGPKIDFAIEDCLGRNWQCGTIQADFQLPQRFDLAFTASDGKLQRPVMIHPAAMGSIERFFAVLTEQFAGKFPSWLAPVQVLIIPVSQRHLDHAEAMALKLKADGLRVRVDRSNEKLGKKMAVSRLARVPYRIVIGDKEVAANTLSVRTRDEATCDVSVATFVQAIRNEVSCRSAHALDAAKFNTQPGVQC
jgi:threonyl-tRNA synthetase